MIDLNLFIEKENTRINAPWEDGEYVFASNGHILIRVLKDHGYTGDLKNPPNTKGIVKEEGPFVATSREELNEALRTVFDFTEPKNFIDCPECGGHGWVGCNCPECNNDHTRECDFCDGRGDVQIKDMDKEDFYRVRKGVPFKETAIAYRYMKLIADTMKQVGGAWEVLITGPLDTITFRSNGAGVLISVMPVRLGAKVS